MEHIILFVYQECLWNILVFLCWWCTFTSLVPSLFPAKLDIATKVITDNLGRKWRAYGRKLGLPEAKLDHISQKHPNDLEEQVVELLKEWRKMQKAEAKTDTLIQALRSCDQNYTADLIQTELEKLKANGGQWKCDKQYSSLLRPLLFSYLPNGLFIHCFHSDFGTFIRFSKSPQFVGNIGIPVYSWTSIILCRVAQCTLGTYIPTTYCKGIWGKLDWTMDIMKLYR